MTDSSQFLRRKKFPSADLNPPKRPTHSPAPDRPFEIGIAMAGAVAAGAYHGGVMDFIVEALDAWYDAKGRGEDAPPHDVVLKVITGASGGGMTAALAALSLGRKTDPVREDPGVESKNPFFHAWVNEISIWKLLGDRDLEGDRKLISFLDSTALDDIGNRARTGAASLPLLTQRRGWLDSRLAVHITLGNLRGVPFWSSLRGTDQQGYGIRLHRDHARFVLCLGNGAKVFADECRLDPSTDSNNANWKFLINCALASGAFPLFLAPRQIDMGQDAYRYRVVVCPDLNEPDYVAVSPHWSLTGSNGSDYGFTSVDGGMMNNEPLDLARHVLAGRFGRNPRQGDKAIRATILVDPFPELSDGPSTEASGLTIFGAVKAIPDAWKMQARARIEELALASEEDVYSRFIIAPDRGNQAIPSRSKPNMEFHLAGGFLEGFGGFLSRTISVHDYLLGRRNAQAFLAEDFALPKDHPLFENWSDAQRQRYAIPDDCGTPAWLPIIPLVKTEDRDLLTDLPVLPDWPDFETPTQGEPFDNGADLIRKLKAAVFKRFRAIWPALVVEFRPTKLGGRLVFGIVKFLLPIGLRSKIREAINGIEERMIEMQFMNRG